MSDPIQELKEAEKNGGGQSTSSGPAPVPPARPQGARRKNKNRRQRPSLFGPILLIGLGFYFLLTNLNIIDGDLHWEAIFRLWPVFLIFLGVNIIVRQLPGALGTLASGLVGVTAVLLVGAVLLFADELPFVNQFATRAGTVERAAINQPLGEAERATITIDASSLPLEIDALNDSSALIAGEVSYVGDIIENYEPGGREARYSLDVRNQEWYTNFSWGLDDNWDLSLTPRIPLDLTIDLGSGASQIDLGELQLSALEIDGGSGATTIALPAGDYKVEMDMGSGSSQVSLDGSGIVEMTVDGGSGSMRFVIPAGTAMRIDVEDGSGGLILDERFVLVSGDRNGDGVWETRSYELDAPNRVDIKIDIGSGSFSVGSN